jgi:hypothetical protein
MPHTLLAAALHSLCLSRFIKLQYYAYPEEQGIWVEQSALSDMVKIMARTFILTLVHSLLAQPVNCLHV